MGRRRCRRRFGAYLASYNVVDIISDEISSLFSHNIKPRSHFATRIILSLYIYTHARAQLPSSFIPFRRGDG